MITIRNKIWRKKYSKIIIKYVVLLIKESKYTLSTLNILISS